MVIPVIFLVSNAIKLTEETDALKIKKGSQYSGRTKISLTNQTKFKAIPTKHVIT